MAHVLKYELLCNSKLNNLYKLKLLFEGYEGEEVHRDVPLNPFFLKKDKAGVIRGTSLQFSIREEVDFEFLEFYTNNAKYIKAELYKSTTLIWSGYVAPQQYQVPLKPAPCTVTFLATDGLGLLKNEDFTLTGSHTQLEMIIHCLDKIALDLGYSIAIDLFEAGHDEDESPLAQTYEDASLYGDFSCYEVLEKMLGKYNAEISQCGGRWRIVSDNDKKSTPVLYTYEGVYEDAGSAITTLDLDMPGLGDVYPVGTPHMELQPGGKKVKISHSFGRKDSMLANYDFLEYASSMFTDWSKNGSFDVEQREHEGKKYAFLEGYSNTGTDYIHQSIAVVNTDADDFVFEINVSPLGSLSHGYSGKSSIQMQVKMMVRLYDGDSTYYWLGTEGWETSETYITLTLPSSIRYPVWQPVSITTAALPCSGTMLVRLYRYQAESEPENTNYRGIGYSIVRAFPLVNDQLLPGKLETVATFDNSTEPGKLSDIDVFIADPPDYDNAVLLYKYITKLSGGSVTSLWHRRGSESEYSLVVQLARMLASSNRIAREKLTGVFKGSSLSFDSIIKYAYNSDKEYEIAEGTWSLYEERWSVTLLEMLAWSSETVTFVTETSQGASISQGSTTIITGVSSGNAPTSAPVILDLLLAVDGTGSLLDADFLDGHHATYFATADHLHTETYIPLITSPVNNNLPLMNAVGGLVTSSYKPSDFQAADADLTAIAALGFVSTSFLKKTAENTWALDAETYIPTISGSFTGYFPTITAGGTLLGSAYQPTDFASSTHNHDSTYVKKGVASGAGYIAYWSDSSTIVGYSNIRFNGSDIFFVDVEDGMIVVDRVASIDDGDLTYYVGGETIGYLYIQGLETDIDFRLCAKGAGSIELCYGTTKKAETTSAGFSATALTASGTTKVAGYFYAGTDAPTSSTRLNYDGYLYAKKLYSEGAEVSLSTHNHDTEYISLVTSPVNGNIPLMNAVGELVTSIYDPSDFQAADADLTAIAALGFVSTSFLKKTAENTWALDTNTYAPTATGGSTGDMLKQTAGGGFISAGFSYSEVSLTSHNHDASYSAIGHNHNGTYEPVLGNPAANAYLLSSTSAGVRSWISKNDVYTAFQTLTYSSSVTWTLSNGYNAKITLTGDCELTISGAASGMSGCLIVVQNATGGHTLTFADTTHNKIIDGGLLTLNETANYVNILTFVCDGTDCFWSYGNNYLSPS